MGIFSRNSGSSTPSLPTPVEPERTREELAAITRSQQSGDPSDPGRGPVQSTTGRHETVIT